MVGHLNLATLSEFTAYLSQHLDITAFLVDAAGVVIAHPNKDHVATRASIQTLGIDPDLLTGQAEFVQSDGSQEAFFLGSQALSSTGWRLGVMQSEATALAQVRRFKIFIWGATLLAATLALLLAMTSIRAAVRPLQRFTSEAKRVAAGEYTLDLAASPFEEIEELRKAFFQMVKSVWQREAMLQQQADEFRSYYELGLIGMAELDPSGCWLSVNPYLEEMLQQQSTELIGRSWWDLSDATERTREQELFADVIAGRKTGYGVQKRFHLPGRVIDTEVSVAAVQSDPDSAISLLIVIIQDITEKKQIQQTLLEHHQDLERIVEERTRSLHAANIELARSQEEYAELYENAPDMYCTISAAPFTIVQCNQRIVSQLGWEKSALLGQTIEMLYPAEELTAATAYFSGIVASNVPKETEQQLRHIGGRVIDAVLTVSPTFDNQGQLRDIKCCWVDIGGQKAVQRRLSELTRELGRSNQELQQFAYVASHDLQEPLRMVASYTQLLVERYADQLDERATKYLGYAREGAERMQQLVEDLLSYSRVTTRGMELGAVASAEVLAKVLVNLHRRVEESGAVITHDPLPLIRGDASQLMQLFQNLIGNALKFQRETEPKIHIGVIRKDQHWQFSVTDNGIGIDPRYASKIFTIFQRLHTREEFPGTGIGLAICKRIVERHNGAIWFASVPQEGTTFFFTLPAVASEEMGEGA